MEKDLALQSLTGAISPRAEAAWPSAARKFDKAEDFLKLSADKLLAKDVSPYLPNAPARNLFAELNEVKRKLSPTH